MATYAVGDLQGCYDPFARLLEALKFDESKDKLWIAGDLINRGQKSLKTLRMVHANQHCMFPVLGNHDLHVLKLSILQDARINRSLQKLMNAPDREELFDWLREQPLVRFDQEMNTLMAHAGIWPGWDVPTAIMRAEEVQAALTGKGFRKFLRRMPGNTPARWSGKLTGQKRLRFIVNAFTRMRMVHPNGRLELRFSGPPAKAPEPLLPWFNVRKRKARDTRIVFGHWSALGYKQKDNLVSLDTGCVWGRSLTAVRLDKPGKKPVSVSCGCQR